MTAQVLFDEVHTRYQELHPDEMDLSEGLDNLNLLESNSGH